MSLRTSLGIVGSVLLDRSYKDAPVGPLFFEGCQQDLALKSPTGSAPTVVSMSGYGQPWKMAARIDQSGSEPSLSTTESRSAAIPAR
ncbi:LssY C-terminal domain-containing protein [Bradyrhizobium sp. 192]|nr:LssY C-terminal domain-containing protein [Bradyrhizobium sp. 192]